jgi:hypothetical protein
LPVGRYGRTLQMVPARASATPRVYQCAPMPLPVYPYGVAAAAYKKEFPADLARAGEARHFIAWTGAVGGLRGGSLSDLAVATEAVLTDVFLSVEEDGTLEVESETVGGAVRVTLRHPELRGRRMSDLEGIMEQYLDGHELSPTEAVLIKRL